MLFCSFFLSFFFFFCFSFLFSFLFFLLFFFFSMAMGTNWCFCFFFFFFFVPISVLVFLGMMSIPFLPHSAWFFPFPSIVFIQHKYLLVPTVMASQHSLCHLYKALLYVWYWVGWDWGLVDHVCMFFPHPTRPKYSEIKMEKQKQKKKNKIKFQAKMVTYCIIQGSSIKSHFKSWKVRIKRLILCMLAVDLVLMKFENNFAKVEGLMSGLMHLYRFFILNPNMAQEIWILKIFENHGHF